MLHLWKRSDKNTSESHDLLETSSTECRNCYGKLSKITDFADNSLLDIEKYESEKVQSRFLRTVPDLINNKQTLKYLIQFMESINAEAFVLCLIEIINFKSVVGKFEQAVEGHNVPKKKGTAIETVTTQLNNVNIEEMKGANCVVNDITCDSCSSDTSCKLHHNRHFLIEQSLEIFKKFIAQEACCDIGIENELRQNIMKNICEPNTVLSGQCFDRMEMHLLSVIEEKFLDAFLHSAFYAKHQLEIFTTGIVALEDILTNETVLFYFMEFLERENVRYLLDFWMAATHFQQQNYRLDVKEMQSDALILYEKYFSLQAQYPLGLSNKVRLSIEINICSDDENSITKSFVVPLKVVEQILERNYVGAFLSSDLFFKFLSELINQAPDSNDTYFIPNNEHKYTYHRGSNLSLGRSNSEISNCSKDVANSSDFGMDVSNLSNPDALWQRKKRILSCGTVSELGKFETFLDPEPDKNHFKFKNMLKKIVSHEVEDKKKEDFAWQVAEMIVKDITNITLAPNSSNKFVPNS